MEDIKARALQDYLKEQFPNTPGFFLYKDKKLLEQGSIDEFVKRQQEKANRIKWSFSGAAMVAGYLGIKNLIAYGDNPEWPYLAVGLFSLAFLLIGLVITVKNCYKIKSAMDMLTKILNLESRQYSKFHENMPGERK